MTETTAAQQMIIATKGDRSMAYQDLVNRYKSMLVGQAVALTGNSSDAEDVVQETFCEAIEDLEQLAQVHSVGAWLRTLNRARALKRVRHLRCDRRHSCDLSCLALARNTTQRLGRLGVLGAQSTGCFERFAQRV